MPESKLVVSSTFFPDELIKVEVGASESVLSEVNPIGSDNKVMIPNATVAIFSGNRLEEQLRYVEGEDESGYYTSDVFKPSIGSEYLIQVSAPNYNPVEAVSSIPPPVQIELSEPQNLTRLSKGPSDIYTFDLDIDYEDPSGEVNYYNLRIFQQLLHYTVAFNGDTIISNTYSVARMAFPEDAFERWTVAANYGGILLVDRPFDDKLKLSLMSPVDRESQLLGALYVEFRTVSTDYYLYQKSLSQQVPIFEGTLNPPVTIHNNVENGLGLFAGYASTSDTLRLLPY